MTAGEQHEARDVYLGSVLEGIHRSDEGFIIQAVLGIDGGFAYTVGLTARGFPELWVDALPAETAALVLTTAAEHIVKAGGCSAGDVIPAEEITVPLRLRGPVSGDEAGTFIASAIYEHPFVVRVMQVLWPDSAGRWPDVPGHSSPQRVLSLEGAPS